VSRNRPLPYRRGVGIALINREGRVFVAERIDTKGAWQMPQGGIDRGETPLQAARRELEEETGIAHARIIAVTRAWLRYDLPARLQAKVWGGKYRGQEQKWFLMLFTGDDTDIDIDAHHAEFARWKWLPFARLPKVIVGFKRAIYGRVVAAFAGKVAALTRRGTSGRESRSRPTSRRRSGAR
jgi:putative (di)nucleoside polyphosphate hydrolase